MQIVKNPLPRSQSSQGSIEDLMLQKKQALQILANLALREYLRPAMFANEGGQLFLDVIKSKNTDLRNDLSSRRTATKGLVNLIFSKRDVKLSVISQLTEEIR